MFHCQQEQISKESSNISQKGQQTTTKTAKAAHSVGAQSLAPLLIQRAKADPSSLRADEVLTLQKTLGNQAVSRLLAGRNGQRVQAKLTIGELGDKYEQEADQVAAEVVRQINAPTVSGEGHAVQRQMPEDKDELQTKSMVQHVSDGGMATSPELETSIQQVRGSGQPLADTVCKSTPTLRYSQKGAGLDQGHPQRQSISGLGESAFEFLSATAPVIQRVRGYDDLLPIKKRDEGEFLRTLFGTDLSVSVWKFPKQQSGDGVIGRNTISAAHHVLVQDTQKSLALHLNFMVSAGSFTKPATEDDYGTLTLNLSKLHITARSAGDQSTIVADGPSILTAARSIHCGPNNDWDWEDQRVQELINAINASLPNLQATLAERGQAYVANLRDSLKAEMRRAARNREVNVVFNGDNTWQ
jgi:hypothetical protein